LKFGVAGANRILIILQGWPMAFYGLRLEYALEDSSNYISWKDRMEVVLEDNGLKDFIDQEIPKPSSTNAQELAEWKKCVASVRRIILEGVRDHIVSSLHGKDTPYSMWKTLKDLYQNSSNQRKLALKDSFEKSRWRRVILFPHILTRSPPVEMSLAVWE